MAGSTKLPDTIYVINGACLTGHHEGVSTDTCRACVGINELSNGQTAICNCPKNCHGTADLGRD